MSKIKVSIVLILFALNQISAQNTLHLCVGTTDNNFSVPYTIGSTYQWQIKSNTNIASIASGNGTEHILIDLNNVGVFKLVVDEIDINGCKGSDSIWVEIHNLPSPTIFSLGSTSFCYGDSVRIEVDSSYSQMIWNNGLSGMFVYADSTMNYFVTVTDTNGCVNNSNPIAINVHPNPVAFFNSQGFCFGDPTIFTDLSSITSDSIVSRIWYFGDGLTDSGSLISHTFNNLGNYQNSLFVISDFGCTDSISNSLTIYQNPIAEFTFSPSSISIIDSAVSFTNLSSYANNFLWNFGDSSFSSIESPIHVFKDPGIYDVTLTITDSNYCRDSIVKELIVYYEFILYIPNSFTPNNDNDNDSFGPLGVRMNKYNSYEFTVFNRWGEIVFQANNVNKLWDGKNASAGSYGWTIRIIDEVGGVHRKTGSVLLIR